MPTHLMLPPWIGMALTAVVCGGALWKGGPDERNMGAAVLFAIMMTVVFRDRSWSGIQWGAFAADILLLAVMTVIAMRSERYWPLPATAFQLLAVITHFARVIDPVFKPWAYATAAVIWAQLVLWTLGIGTLNAWRRRAQPAMSAAPEAAGATRR